VTTHRRLTIAERAEVDDEGGRLAAFLTDGAADGVRVAAEA
jgi:hypothetical protein